MKKFAFAAFLALGLLALLAPPQAFAQDEKPFTLHGEVRFRAEYSANTTDFDNDGGDDNAGYWPYRARIAAEGHFTDDVSAWIEFQNTGLFGEQGFLFGPFDATAPRRYNDIRSNTSLYQAAITLDKLWSDNFSLRFGRQEMVLGNEFLFGDEDFYAGISHDGVVGMFNHKKWNLTVWYDRAVENTVFQYADQDFPPDAVAVGDGSDVDHFGGYFSFGVGKNSVVDAYLFNVNDRPIGGQYQTLGGRFARDNWDKGFIWNVELAVQFGTASAGRFTTPTPPVDADASGMGAEAMFGFNFGGDKRTHRVYGRLEYATGDDTTTADDNEGFINPWGELHNRAGRGDWFRVAGNSTFLGGVAQTGGLMAFSVGYTGRFSDKHEVGGAFWDYSLEEDSGSVDGDGLGTAFDLWYGYTYSKNVTFEVSYSSLSPDDALTTPSVLPDTDDAVERLYGQVRLRF